MGRRKRRGGGGFGLVALGLVWLDLIHGCDDGDNEKSCAIQGWIAREKVEIFHLWEDDFLLLSSGGQWYAAVETAKSFF